MANDPVHQEEERSLTQLLYVGLAVGLVILFVALMYVIFRHDLEQVNPQAYELNGTIIQDIGPEMKKAQDLIYKSLREEAERREK